MRDTLSQLLRLESLDDRIVPAIDLTTAGASEMLDNGAIVQQTDAQPTGTGYIQSFVRIQGEAPGGGGQEGYNTDGRPLQFDEKASANFTRSLTLDDVPIVVVDGVAYREFLLDINQKTSSRYLSLDEVRIYLGNAPDLTGYDAATQTLGGLSAIYDLDSAGDVSVLLNAALNSGSGSGDMNLLIPQALFAGYEPTTFVYLYSKMGVEAGATANGGFEEWAVRDAPSTIPEGTASLSGRVFFDANQDGVFDDLDDHGIGGVIMHLRGVNDLGLTVDLIVPTDENGFYSFTGLRTGEYTLWETQPEEFADGNDYVGSAGGNEDIAEDTGILDAFTNIQLFDGDNAMNYFFTEKLGGEGG
jgi:hypothetical protein